MRIRSLVCAALIAGIAFGQGSSVPIPFSSQQFFSYSTVSPTTPPSGAQFQIVFPNQTNGAQISNASCSTYSNLAYNHYTYSGSTWTGPVTGPVLASPQIFYTTTTPITGWTGLNFEASMTGGIASNSSPSTQTFIQSIFVSGPGDATNQPLNNYCFEYGPEFGFYRLLQNPGNSTEEMSIYFYYAMNPNCYNVGSLGSCRDRNTGASLVANTTTYKFTLPPTNSHGGTNYIYKAQLAPSGANFAWSVSITDPYNGTGPSAFLSIDSSSYFYSQASNMLAGGMSGLVSTVQQRNSPSGGITNSVGSPSTTTVYSLNQYTLNNPVPPIPVTGAVYAGVNGNCTQGNRTVSVLGYQSSTLVMGSYPSCRVSVYNAGTVTLATIYADSIGTAQANPFTAKTTGNWNFYAQNGTYDVQLSSGGIATPFTLGGMSLFGLSGYQPTNVLAYGASGIPGVMGVYDSTHAYYEGFTVGAISTNTLWTLPPVDGVGCMYSNGAGVISFFPCISSGGGGGGGNPGGVNTNIQYNGSGVFAGDSNFTWDPVNQKQVIIGVPGTPTLAINGGYAVSYGGYVSAVGSWQGFNTDTDGALLRGLNIAEDISGNSGGYINMAPIDTSFPSPLPGLTSFGLHTAVMWVGPNNLVTPDTTYGLNLNLYLDAAGGVRGENTLWNTLQAPNGGVYGKSLTALSYVQTGNSLGVPAPTSGDTFHAGALYYDTTSSGSGLRVFNGTAWVSVSGASSPGGPNGAVQFNNTGTLGGVAQFVFNVGANALVVPNLIAGTTSAAGVIQSYGAANSTAVFQITQLGTGTTPFQIDGLGDLSYGGILGAIEQTAPSLSAAGHSKLYIDSTTHVLTMSTNGGAYSAVGSGSSTAGGANTNVQFNSSGAFGGSANFIWNNGSQQLVVTSTSSSTSGIAVKNGFIVAENGFEAFNITTPTTPLNYNTIQVPFGGMSGLSYTAQNYVQPGSYATTLASGPPVTNADTFHAGAISYYSGSTGGPCLVYYTGSTWACIATGGGSGVSSIAGTANQVIASASTGAVTLSLPQSIATTSSVTFGNVTTGSNASASVIQAWAANNTTAAFQVIRTGSGGSVTPFQVDGIGDVSANGDVNLTGSGSYKVGGTAAINALRQGIFAGGTTVAGGFTAGNAGQFSVDGSGNVIGPTISQTTYFTAGVGTVINSGGLFVGPGVNVGTSGITTSGSVQSSASGSAIAFQTSSPFNFQVDGFGDVSLQGILHIAGRTTDPTTGSPPVCSSSADIGKIWPDTTTSTTSWKRCTSITGTVQWQVF